MKIRYLENLTRREAKDKLRGRGIYVEPGISDPVVKEIVPNPVLVPEGSDQQPRPVSTGEYSKEWSVDALSSQEISTVALVEDNVLTRDYDSQDSVQNKQALDPIGGHPSGGTQGGSMVDNLSVPGVSGNAPVMGGEVNASELMEEGES